MKPIYTSPGYSFCTDSDSRYHVLLRKKQGSHTEMANTVSVEANLKVSAQKVWGALKESGNLFPKILPSQFKSIEVIEGDGTSVGSVRLIKHGEGVRGFTYTKEKIEFVDEANKIVKSTVTEGEILNAYKTFKPTIKVIQGADANSSVIKWSVEFEPANAEVPPPDLAKEAALDTFKGLEAYLLGSKPAA